MHYVKQKLILIGGLVLGFYPLWVYAQPRQLTIVYRVTKNYMESKAVLVTDNIVSVWKELERQPNERVPSNFISDDHFVPEQVVKNFTQNTLYCDYNILQARFFVKDPVDLQTWFVLNKDTVFLNQECGLARTQFRGRSYLAFYSKKLTIPDGPWKFQGLPGLILKIYSEDKNENYVWEAVEIKRSEEDIAKWQNDFFVQKPSKDKFTNWDEFVALADKHITTYSKKIKSSWQSEGETGITANIKINNFPEIFNHNIQTQGMLIKN
ncbi:MAG: hypothetical protein KatS3mg032_1106 [Cyclobacteriaceae bacterium]|nr:MAG: hypothetical protein KatS3mg032_1106 [Cyclobacteriaceae bacterium]